MCEITVIAIVFLVAIEFNCKDLFNATNSTQTINKPMQRDTSNISSRFDCHNMDSCQNISILCFRKRAGKKTKEADAVDGKNM